MQGSFSIDVKNLARIQGGAGKRWGDQPRQHNTSHRTDAAWGSVTRLSAGSICRSRSTPQPGCSRRSPRRREDDHRDLVLHGAAGHFAGYGITMKRLITGSGSARSSMVRAIARRTLGVRYLRTRPYRHQTTGKTRLFIRTVLEDGSTARPSMQAPRARPSRPMDRLQQPPETTQRLQRQDTHRPPQRTDQPLRGPSCSVSRSAWNPGRAACRRSTRDLGTSATHDEFQSLMCRPPARPDLAPAA
jgi:hypothetical protein